MVEVFFGSDLGSCVITVFFFVCCRFRLHFSVFFFFSLRGVLGGS